MRHRRKAKYFGVKTAHRKAMFRNMVTSLFRHGRITTTVPRAKELRRLADKLITLAKDGSLHARRQALSVIMDKAVVAKLFTEIAEQMATRNGGYTRIVRTGPRRGDGAMMCIIELVKESIKSHKTKTSRPAEEVAPTVIPSAVEKADEQPSAETQPIKDEALAEEETSPEAEVKGQTPDEEAISSSSDESIQDEVPETTESGQEADTTQEEEMAEKDELRNSDEAKESDTPASEEK